MTQLARITQQAEVMGGKACIRGMRVTVRTEPFAQTRASESEF